MKWDVYKIYKNIPTIRVHPSHMLKLLFPTISKKIEARIIFQINSRQEKEESLCKPVNLKEPRSLEAPPCKAETTT